MNTVKEETEAAAHADLEQGQKESASGTTTAAQSRTDFKLTDQTNLLPFRKVVSVFAGLAVCIVVSTLDMTLVATALPSLSADFHAGMSFRRNGAFNSNFDGFFTGSVSSFVASAYLLTSTAFQPLYGRFSDIFGRKAALCLAMGVFMIGNLAAGFSRKISEAIIFRGTFPLSLRKFTLC